MIDRDEGGEAQRSKIHHCSSLTGIRHMVTGGYVMVFVPARYLRYPVTFPSRAMPRSEPDSWREKDNSWSERA
jgi:hypothetical protein